LFNVAGELIMMALLLGSSSLNLPLIEHLMSLLQALTVVNRRLQPQPGQ
jgi:hypothetical protein